MNLTDELQAAFQRKVIRAYLLPQLFTQLCHPAWKTYEIFFPQLFFTNNTLIDLKPMSSITFGDNHASITSQDQIANINADGNADGGGRRLFHVSYASVRQALGSALVVVLINFIVILLLITLMVTLWFIRGEKGAKVIQPRMAAGMSVQNR